MNRHHPLDDAFRQKLRDYSAETPTHLWEKIEQHRDWKHRFLNKARQHKPLAGLFAAVLLTGLCWMVSISQQPALGNFPIPITGGATASLHSPEPAAIAPAKPAQTPSETATDPRPMPSSATADTPHPGPQAKATVAKDAARETVQPEEGQRLVEKAAVQEVMASDAQSPALRPEREEMPPLIPAAWEKQQTEGLGSFLDGLFTQEPKCAQFGNHSWAFYIDALASPDLAFRQLQARNPDYEDYTASRRETESNMYSFSGSLRLSMVSAGGLAFRTGINYSQINEKFSYVNGSEEIITTRVNRDDEGNVIGIDTIVEIGTRRKITQNQYRMLDIPFILGYEMQHDRLTVSFNGGAYLNLLFRQEGDFLSPNDMKPVRFDSGDPDAYPAFKQQVGLGWYGSLGFAYQTNSNLQIVIEPHFKLFPKSVTREQYGVQQSYMSTGLFIGLRQQL